jgi:hypothetical protein
MQVEFANHYQVPERKFGMLHLIWALSLFVAYLVATVQTPSKPEELRASQCEIGWRELCTDSIFSS